MVNNFAGYSVDEVNSEIAASNNDAGILKALAQNMKTILLQYLRNRLQFCLGVGLNQVQQGRRQLLQLGACLSNSKMP